VASVSRIAGILLALLAVVLIVSQWRAIRTENVNWDEFALLFRAHESVRTGNLVGGGRPGLAVLMLIPFVKDCASAVDAVVSARQLWLGFTVAYLAGVFVLVLEALRGQRHAWHSAAAAVALLGTVPVFLRWSLQVRTDQLALMFAAWGGVCLLASCRQLTPGGHKARPYGLAMAAGVLFALGFLATPKAAYVGVLAAILFVLRLARATHASPLRRGLAVSTAAAASFGVTVALYYGIASLFYQPQPIQTVQSGLNAFDYYRSVFGYRAYLAMLPTLIPHILLLALALCALVISLRRPLRSRDLLIAGWLVLLAGVAVGRFHAAAFPYFWMTLGLFAAVGLALAWTAILEVFEGPAGKVLLAGAALVLLLPAVPAAVGPSDDTQRVQRDALMFIDRNFDPAARGFQSEGALFCRIDPAPFPTYFGDAMARQFGSESGRVRAEALINEFRSRPVTFMIAHRIFPFPLLIEEFWKSHYVLYRDEVMIPGRPVGGARGDVFELDVIVPGEYRWRPVRPGRLAINGVELEAGGVVHLDTGVRRFMLMDDVPTGLLTLAVKDDPRPADRNFYDPLVIREIDPLYPRF
jgi:hypothetical protein